MKRSEIKNLLFELTYECETYRYQIMNYMNDHPDYDKDLDSFLSHYDGYDHALSVILRKLEWSDDYVEFAHKLDDKKGIDNLASLPKLDNPFEEPEKLQ